MKIVYGNFVDVFNRKIYPAQVTIMEGAIASIEPLPMREFTTFIMPGFVDAHVHVESSMLLPKAFSDILIPRGVVGTVSDPHEIANVLGVRGVLAMLRWSKHADCKINYTIPSCVPATSFDGSGAKITPSDVEALAASGSFVGLSEVMDVGAVTRADADMVKKLNAARANNLAIDGHAPLLSGVELQMYASRGITTDHECTSIEEAREKLKAGMKIIIREGSAAHNYAALKELIAESPDSVMFCTDDAHSDKIMKTGGVDSIVRRAVADYFDLFDVLKIASVNPVMHYKLPIGLLRVGDPADFIVVKNLKKFEVLETYISGRKVYDGALRMMLRPSRYKPENERPINKFVRGFITADEIKSPLEFGDYAVIKLIPGELLTEEDEFTIKTPTPNFEADVEADILKLVYINRYHAKSKPQVAFVKGFQLKSGAIATSVSHDSHNIIAVGTNDADLLSAINSVIECKGGLVFTQGAKTKLVPLPFAGLMSDRTGTNITWRFGELRKAVAAAGCKLPDPFMALSFLSLLVIPSVKIGEQGLFDYRTFSFRKSLMNTL